MSKKDEYQIVLELINVSAVYRNSKISLSTVFQQEKSS